MVAMLLVQSAIISDNRRHRSKRMGVKIALNHGLRRPEPAGSREHQHRQEQQRQNKEDKDSGPTVIHGWANHVAIITHIASREEFNGRNKVCSLLRRQVDQPRAVGGAQRTVHFGMFSIRSAAKPTPGSLPAHPANIGRSRSSRSGRAQRAAPRRRLESGAISSNSGRSG
jgi:hypothetical protein